MGYELMAWAIIVSLLLSAVSHLIASNPWLSWQRKQAVVEQALQAIARRLTRLIECSVDTIEKCRDCEYRYLCGGACRAWGNQSEPNLNAAPPACAHLRERARKLVEAARKYILE